MSLWATQYIELLEKGETIKFRPRGNSMTPLIQSGELCTIYPTLKIKTGDIVLCKVNGNHYLHKVLSVNTNRILIGNNHGKINGWTQLDKVYGKVIKTEP